MFSKERPTPIAYRLQAFLVIWVIAYWLLPLLQEEEEVQVPEEVEEVEEEVREEGTFQEEAWEGDYQAEEYVEAKW